MKPQQSNPRNVPVAATLAPPTHDTVTGQLTFISQLCDELNRRTSHIATTIAGPIPESNEKEGEPSCVSAHLGLITASLTRALSELDRAQSFL